MCRSGMGCTSRGAHSTPARQHFELRVYHHGQGRLQNARGGCNLRICREVQKIILEVARSAVHIFGRLVIQSTQQAWSDTIFQQLDKDNDGSITPEEMFGDFPPGEL
jgi:hypothetical protein